MPFPSGLRALNHRDFRLFWSGQLVSLIGNWMQSVGQAWLVLELTNSPFRLGLIGTLQFGPVLLLSLPAGTLADRLPKRRLLLAAQTTLMIQAFVLGLLAWSGHVQYWHVAVLATLYGLANALDMPTRQAFIVELVGKDDLLNAIALNSASFNTARVLGPAVAGVLIARYGVPVAFLLNGASFVSVLAALFAMRAEGRPHGRSGASVLQETLTGIRYALGTSQVRVVLALVLVVSLFMVNHSVLVPLLAREVLRAGARGFGWLMAGLGSGAVAGALTVAMRGGSRPRLPVLIGSSMLMAVALWSLSLIRVFWAAVVALALVGFFQIVFMAHCNTTLQVTVPDRLRGRLMSVYAFVFVGVAPLSSLLVGSSAELLGVPATFALGGGLGLASILALTLWARRTVPREDPASSGG
jgi:MFS family permease